MKPLIFFAIIALASCGQQTSTAQRNTQNSTSETKKCCATNAPRTIHVFVALCDNVNQGIVPVPAKIGNGQDPANNLYWGCKYGVFSYFKASTEWQLLATQKVDEIILQRAIFKHKKTNTYFIADAYDGKYIAKAMHDAMQALASQHYDTIHYNNNCLPLYSGGSIISFVGHNGLMDKKLDNTYTAQDSTKRTALFFACYGKHYFSPYFSNLNISNAMWSTGLMSPEAYSLHAALEQLLAGKKIDAAQQAAAMAYCKYQHCSLKAASKLIVAN